MGKPHLYQKLVFHMNDADVPVCIEVPRMLFQVIGITFHNDAGCRANKLRASFIAIPNHFAWREIHMSMKKGSLVYAPSQHTDPLVIILSAL